VPFKQRGRSVHPFLKKLPNNDSPLKTAARAVWLRQFRAPKGKNGPGLTPVRPSAPSEEQWLHLLSEVESGTVIDRFNDSNQATQTAADTNVIVAAGCALLEGKDLCVCSFVNL